jgi:hypothetical protein
MNPKIRWPYTLPRDAEAIEITRMPIQKPLFDRQTPICALHM